MHLGQVKIWMRQHDCGADWELPEAEQHQLKEWFNALDIDGSGGAAACYRCQLWSLPWPPGPGADSPGSWLRCTPRKSRAQWEAAVPP